MARSSVVVIERKLCTNAAYVTNFLIFPKGKYQFTLITASFAATITSKNGLLFTVGG
jgi:hypothetical protein